MHLEIVSAKWPPFCSGLILLNVNCHIWFGLLSHGFLTFRRILRNAASSWQILICHILSSDIFFCTTDERQDGDFLLRWYWLDARPVWRQANIWTNAGLLSTGPLQTTIQRCSFTKMHLKVSSAKWRPFCPILNVLIRPMMTVSAWFWTQFCPITTHLQVTMSCLFFLKALKTSTRHVISFALAVERSLYLPNK